VSEVAEQVLLVERSNRVLVLTLNRPASRNAINLAMAKALAAALDDLDDDPGLSAGVITGAPPGFSAGMDLKAFSAGELPVIPGRGFGGIVDRASRKPLIAAVEGFALGGGFEVVLACDLVVAARDSHFALPEVRRGLIAAFGGLVRLPRRIPEAIAMEIALTGEPIAAPRLYELGLVNRLVEAGQALAGALELAGAIAANSPLAVRTSKEVLTRQREWTADAAGAEQQALWERVVASPDAREGAAAFAEKRAPRWQTD